MPAAVLCVIEVADASLHHDRTVKQQIYADSGLPQYIILNLPELPHLHFESLSGRRECEGLRGGRGGIGSRATRDSSGRSNT
ncbi:MAG: hypothetical protein GXY83_07850 [Rhodopirellula sp.]|nr:hypothetical protein [Rhodopirellula sp.]